MKLRPHIHRTHLVRLHGSPGEAVSLDSYITCEREEMTAAHLRELSGFTGQMFAKLATDQARQHLDLHEGTEHLVRILGSAEVQACTDPLPHHLAEAGVAAAYLLKGMDLIPDSVPEIGLTDDARLMARVFDRNPELLK